MKALNLRLFKDEKPHNLSEIFVVEKARKGDLQVSFGTVEYLWIAQDDSGDMLFYKGKNSPPPKGFTLSISFGDFTMLDEMLWCYESEVNNLFK